MKRVVLNFFVIAVALMVTTGCKKTKDDPPAKVPVLTTAAISNITAVSAVSGGNVSDDGGAEVTARGVCWGTSSNPAVSGNKTTDGTGKGAFTSNLAGMEAGTTYYVRAYATNSAGTAYGNEASFTTLADVSVVAPAVTTADVTDITAASATAGGNITNAGTPAYTERGVCYATTSAPTIADTKIAVPGTGTGLFTADLTDLTADTKYYVRAYATNSNGTVYGNEVDFTTDEDLTQEEEDRYEEFVTPELEDVLLNTLDMTINRGTAPPDITGYFLMEDRCIRSTIPGDSYVGRLINHYKIKFYDQTGIDVSFEGFEVEIGTDRFIAQHDAKGTLITGSDNKFSVFFEEIVQYPSGPNSILLSVYSGELVKDDQGSVTGIRNFQYVLLMKDTGGRTDVIANGQGRLFEDDFAEAITEEEFGKVIGRTGVKSATVGNDLRSIINK